MPSPARSSSQAAGPAQGTDGAVLDLIGAALKAQQDFEALKPAGDPAALQARLDANPRDHAARFDLAAIHAHAFAHLHKALRDQARDW